jgi:RimJ/RimL family protein N-acetyltransferase
MSHQLLTPPQEIRTDRLVLSPLTPHDIDDVFRVYSDARTWTHLPSGRWTTRAQAEHHVQRAVGDRVRHGLGTWAVRTADDRVLPTGSFVGSGGMSMPDAGVWNLGYRLAPSAWGNGFATEIARAAVQAAHDVAPQTAVTARVLTNNPASAAVIAKSGLSLVWQGRTAAQAPGDAERQVWSDRYLPELAYEWLVAHA